MSIGNPAYSGIYSVILVKARVRKNNSGRNQRGPDINLRVNNNLLGNRTMASDRSNIFIAYIQAWSGYTFTREGMNSLQVLITSTGNVGGSKATHRQVIVDLPGTLIYQATFLQTG